MRTTLKMISYIGKVTGLTTALNLCPFVSPSTGVIIFFVASILESTARAGEGFRGFKAEAKDMPEWHLKERSLEAPEEQDFAIVTTNRPHCLEADGRWITTFRK